MPADSARHLTAQTADDYTHNRLAPEERVALEQHLRSCPACQRMVGESPTVATVYQFSTLDDERKFHAAIDDPSTVLANSKRYRVISKLGGGGMGVVYRARDERLKREVALKVMKPELVADERAVRRFLQEAQAAAQLHHQNIVTTFDADQEGDTHFIVMSYVEGLDLSTYVRRKGPAAVQLACHFAREAAAGLHYAHEHELKMVHRDVKPHNIMVTKKGQVTVLDFGLAKLTQEGGSGSSLTNLALGTPDYMAPEQANDPKSVDRRADIYALGCTLFYLLTGEPPFVRETQMAVLMAHAMVEPPPLPNVPAELAALVARMMAKKPEDRPSSAAEVHRELRPFAKPGSPGPGTHIDIALPIPPTFISWTGGKMRLVKGDRFRMGSPEGEANRDADEKLHWVTVSQFYLGETPVTQGQFRQVLGYNPSYFGRNVKGKEGVSYGDRKPGGGAKALGPIRDTDEFPVENVSWEEANEFCHRLNSLDQSRPTGWEYRLPREAEWEFACRAGAKDHRVFHFGDALDNTETQANFDGNFPHGGGAVSQYLERTREVAYYAPNAFGLHDMHGNVWEWCQDWYDARYYAQSSGETDPTGPATGSDRVVRGGSWGVSGSDCRSASRTEIFPTGRSWDIGFRVALVPAKRA